MAATRCLPEVPSTVVICFAACSSRNEAMPITVRRISRYDTRVIAAPSTRSTTAKAIGNLTAIDWRDHTDIGCKPTMRPMYYGWIVLLVAAAAMVGTLPGRTQGLGLVTEPLMADLGLGRVQYAQLNLWATLIGSLFAIGIGRFIDRLGARIVLTGVALALGVVVMIMSGVQSFWALAVAVTLTRGLGQSALSVISLAMVGQWFVRRIDMAMAIYSVVLSVGFMIAFPVVGSLVQSRGWRFAWLSIAIALIAFLAPAAWLLVRKPSGGDTPLGVSIPVDE